MEMAQGLAYLGNVYRRLGNYKKAHINLDPKASLLIKNTLQKIIWLLQVL